MLFDYRKLRGRIIEKYGSQSKFVKAFGVSSNTFSQKMNNKVRFTSDDIVKMTRLLEISTCDIGPYFFEILVSKNETKNTEKKIEPEPTEEEGGE